LPDNHGDNPDMRGAPWTIMEWSDWSWILDWLRSQKILVSVAKCPRHCRPFRP